VPVLRVDHESGGTLPAVEGAHLRRPEGDAHGAFFRRVYLDPKNALIQAPSGITEVSELLYDPLRVTIIAYDWRNEHVDLDAIRYPAFPATAAQILNELDGTSPGTSADVALGNRAPVRPIELSALDFGFTDIDLTVRIAKRITPPGSGTPVNITAAKAEYTSGGDQSLDIHDFDRGSPITFGAYEVPVVEVENRSGATTLSTFTGTLTFTPIG
jgi:hypothetical protein